MTLRSLLHILPLAASLAIVQAAAPGDQILGTWSPDGGKESKIEIVQCNGKFYCGTIVWMRIPHNDDKNEIPSLRNRPLTSFRMMDAFKFEGGNAWAGGKLYTWHNGKTLPAKFVLVNKNELAIHEGAGEGKVIATWRRVAE